jgi:hypothetical protein
MYWTIQPQPSLPLPGGLLELLLLDLKDVKVEMHEISKGRYEGVALSNHSPVSRYLEAYLSFFCWTSKMQK